MVSLLNHGSVFTVIWFIEIFLLALLCYFFKVLYTVFTSCLRMLNQKSNYEPFYSFNFKNFHFLLKDEFFELDKAKNLLIITFFPYRLF